MTETAANSDQDYLGFFRHGVDDKRRLQIPSRWRPAGENFELTVMIWTAHEAGACLRVLAPKEMRALKEKITSLPGDHPAKEELLHFIGKYSDKLPVDKSGRVCLPDRLAQEASLNGEAILVGLVDKFEIWNPDRYAMHTEKLGPPRREFFNFIK